MKRIISLFICLILLLTIVSTVFAASHTHNWVRTGQEDEGSSTWWKYKTVNSCSSAHYKHKHRLPYFTVRVYYKCNRCGIGKYVDESRRNTLMDEECCAQ